MSICLSVYSDQTKDQIKAKNFNHPTRGNFVISYLSVCINTVISTHSAKSDKMWYESSLGREGKQYLL